MASSFNLTRNDLIKAAFRKLGLGVRQELKPEDQAAAVQALALILREEDGLGFGQDRHLWAMVHRALPLLDGRGVYITTSVASRIDPDIKQGIERAVFRDGAGRDVPLKILTDEQYLAISDKNEVGDPDKIWFDVALNRAQQAIRIHRIPTGVGTTSLVTGSDGLVYSCIMGHTAVSTNKPITGPEWPLYWEQTGLAGSTWVTGTAYTAAKTILYDFKRPLADFTQPSDNPDFPQEWTRYLVLRLAYDLGAEYAISEEEKTRLQRDAILARESLFPAGKARANDFHNKALFM